MKKALNKFGVAGLSAAAILALAACGGNSSSTSSESSTSYRPWDAPTTYTRADDDEVFNNVYGDYQELIDDAHDIQSNNQRFVKYAEAEAELLNTASFVPTRTQNGVYAITRTAPRTVPYVQWGTDEYRFRNVVSVKGNDVFIKSEERAEMLTLWEAAKKGGAAYDPATYLTGKGYTLDTEVKSTMSSGPRVLDPTNTSRAQDSRYLVNCYDGLVEYDNLGNLVGRCAEEDPVTHLPYTLSADGKTYTFKIKSGMKWINQDGGDTGWVVKPSDFRNSFRHMCDSQAGLEFLVQGVVVGANEYVTKQDTNFDHVGVVADDDAGTFSITLCQAEGFFPSRLGYACFSPICTEKFAAQGGVYGVDELAAAKTAGTYKYGQTDNLGSSVYNGAYRPTAISSTEVEFVKNDLYYDAANVRNTKLHWTYDDGKNPELTYNETIKGTYQGITLGESNGLLSKAKKDGHFASYNYVTETNSTTFFGGLNLARGAFSLNNAGQTVVSPKTTADKVKYAYAIENKNFRKALTHAWDRVQWNALQGGEDVAKLSLRNMYTSPDFVSIDAATTDEYGHEFALGTSYGDLVQYYCDKAGVGVTVADGQDGWYNPTLAKHYWEVAKAELGGKINGTVSVDWMYYSGDPVETAQSIAYKECVEKALPGVTINLIAVALEDDYLNGGYYAETGADLTADFYAGSGWGPDYGDPSSYLDTFAYGGYMLKVCGIY